MKFTSLFVLIFSFNILISAQEKIVKGNSSSQNNNQDSISNLQNEFQILADKWKEIYNSKDAKNFASLYLENAQYISAHVENYIADGLENIISNFQKGMSGGGYVYSIKVLSVNSSENFASVVSTYNSLAGGKKVEGRNLLIWKKVNNEWKILTHVTVVKD